MQKLKRSQDSALMNLKSCSFSTKGEKNPNPKMKPLDDMMLTNFTLVIP